MILHEGITRWAVGPFVLYQEERGDSMLIQQGHVILALHEADLIDLKHLLQAAYKEPSE